VITWESKLSGRTELGIRIKDGGGRKKGGGRGQKTKERLSKVAQTPIILESEEESHRGKKKDQKGKG